MANTEGMIHHIEIYVSNIRKSSEFWKDLLESLNYEKYQEWSEGISWKLGDTYIVFVQTLDEFLDIPYDRRRTGLNHLAFHMSSKNRIDEMALKIESKGFKILFDDKYRKGVSNDPYSIFFEDPDGIKIELVLSDES